MKAIFTTALMCGAVLFGALLATPQPAIAQAAAPAIRMQCTNPTMNFGFSAKGPNYAVSDPIQFNVRIRPGQGTVNVDDANSGTCVATSSGGVTITPAGPLLLPNSSWPTDMAAHVRITSTAISTNSVRFVVSPADGRAGNVAYQFAVNYANQPTSNQQSQNQAAAIQQQQRQAGFVPGSSVQPAARPAESLAQECNRLVADKMRQAPASGGPSDTIKFYTPYEADLYAGKCASLPGAAKKVNDDLELLSMLGAPHMLQPAQGSAAPRPQALAQTAQARPQTQNATGKSSFPIPDNNECLRFDPDAENAFPNSSSIVGFVNGCGIPIQWQVCLFNQRLARWECGSGTAQNGEHFNRRIQLSDASGTIRWLKAGCSEASHKASGGGSCGGDPNSSNSGFGAGH